MKATLLELVLVVVTTARCARGFAYAPNFVTKLIEEQTSITPQGLLRQDTDISGVDADVLEKKGGVATLARTEAKPVQIRTRFPPEPNGYLHLGHAKAITFNFAVARMFGGVCHMRMDDTNPSKEDEEYVTSILEDVCWIQEGLYDGQPYPWDGPVRKTSDYFDLIYDCAVALIQSGDAYVDSLTADEMREYRGSLTQPGKNSPYRDRTIAENLELFRGMKEGIFPEGAHVLRAKIAMDSPNVNLRDPTLYRIKHESHQETGDTWCIYPMYDFSHPIADAVEGITHSLCTLEFEDHRPFYDWTLEKCRAAGFLLDYPQPPQQIEFSRLNIQSTVLSKRKLIQLVEGKHVSGWDDPRLPTLSGLRRRGLSPAALRLFCERMGISKADSNIDYAVLEDCARESMDATCPRAMAVLEPLKVTITNFDDSAGLEYFEVDRHPKISAMGQRSVPFGKTVYIERSDFFDADGPEGERAGGKTPKGFKRLLPNGRVRLRYAYVIECNEIVRDPDTNEPVELKCAYFSETRAGVTPSGMERVQGIIHWVEYSTALTCQVNQYDRLFATEEPGKLSGDFLSEINPNSLEVLKGVVVEPSVGDDAVPILDKIAEGFAEDGRLAKIYPSSLTYQFERNGYFALDKEVTGRDKLVFNRVVTLRDTWGVNKKEPAVVRNRGGNASARNQSPQGSETVEDIKRVALRAATILTAKPHPEAENLLVLTVDCGEIGDDGESPCFRTVVAGLAGKFSLNELIGRKVVAVTNLKPARMRGVESTAMLLAATDGTEGEDEKVELLDVPNSVPNGELISFDGKGTSEPDAMMKSKGAMKAWDRAKAGLRLNGVGVAEYSDDNGVYRMVSSAGAITASSLVDAAIQ